MISFEEYFNAVNDLNQERINHLDTQIHYFKLLRKLVQIKELTMGDSRFIPVSKIENILNEED